MAPRFTIDGIRYRSDSECATHLSSGDWIDCTIGEMLRRAAARAPEKTAVVGHDGDLTFCELDEASEVAAASLVTAGLRPGDRAVFQIGTVPEFFTALFACFKAGVVPVATLPQFREIEMEALSRRSGAKAYFVQADVHPSFDQVAFARSMQQRIPDLAHLIVVRGTAGPGELDLRLLQTATSLSRARDIVRPYDPGSEDVAMFQMSGGSTGLPKLIPRYHAEYLGHARAISRRYELTEDDKSLWSLPLIHNAGMVYVVLAMAIFCRTTVVLPRFDAEEFLATVDRRQITFSGSIGPVAPRLLETPDIRRFDLSKLRQFIAMSRADAVEAYTGVKTGNLYGITEGLLMGTAPSESEEARHRTIGRPMSYGDRVRIVRPGTDEEVQLGEVGELCFKGPSSLTAYYGDPEATEASLSSDGFFRTGDLVRGLSIGGVEHYVFEGRLKDNINRGGEKIGAEEVEAVVAAHPAIADVRVVAMPDAIYGEKVCGYVILRPGFELPTLDELARFVVAKGLAKYKTPERIEQIDAFPVTRVGKVDKVQMRAMIAEKLAAENNQKKALVRS